MAERPIPPLRESSALGPIDIIARAERTRTLAVAASAGPDPVEAPEVYPADRPLAPRGLAGLLDAAMGGMRLPGLLELADALDRAAAEVGRPGAVDPAMSEVIVAVLGDEQRKILRYLDLRDR